MSFSQKPKSLLSGKIIQSKAEFYNLHLADTSYSSNILSIDNTNDYYMTLIKTYDSICCTLRKKCEANYQSQLLSNVLAATNNMETLEIVDLSDILNENDARLEATLALINKIDRLSKALQYKLRTENKFSLFPVRNEEDLMTYDHFNDKSNDKFINETRLMFQPNDQYISLYSELYRDYFGLVRLGIGTVLNASNGASKEDTEEELPFNGEGSFEEGNTPNSRAIHKLSSGGGLLVIKTSFPLLYYQNKKRFIELKTELQHRLGIDLPGLGTSLSTYSMNSEWNIYQRLYFGGWTNEMAIIGEARIGYISGNKTFYEQIDKKSDAAFFMHQFSIGLVLNNKFQLAWHIIRGDDFIEKNAKSLLSFSMVME